MIGPRDDAQPYVLTYDYLKMDSDAVSDFVLKSYWGRGLTKEQVKRSFEFSSCIGLLNNGEQLAFARAVTDRETCAYIKDFFVTDAHQGHGLGHILIEGLLNHPDLSRVKIWYLGTKDAHQFYEKFGFKRSPEGIYMYLNADD